MSFNRATILGRLVADPELKEVGKDSTPVVNNRIAFDNGFGDKKKPVFLDVTFWGKQAEFVSKYFEKGSPILVDGRLEMDEWEDKDTEKTRTKIVMVAERCGFAGSKGDGEGSEDEEETPKAKTTGKSRR